LVKTILLTAVFLTEIPLVSSFASVVFKAVLVWGVLYIAYFFFTGPKAFLKNKYLLITTAFLACFAVSVALNFRSPELKRNVYIFVVSAVLLLGVFPRYKKNARTPFSARSGSRGGEGTKALHGADGFFDGRSALLRELEIMSLAVLILTGAAAAVSLGMFLFDFSASVEVSDTVFLYGFVEHRLAGVYKTATCAAPGAGVCAGVCLAAVAFIKRGPQYKLKLALALFAGLLCFCEVALANSRALFYALAAAFGVFAALTVFAAARKRFTRSGELSSGRFTAAAALGAVSLAAASLSTLGLVKLARYLASWAQPAFLFVIRRLDGPFVRADLERLAAADGYGELSGRPAIWRYGLEKFLEKPVFGWGPQTLAGTISTPGGVESVSHFHNIAVQALVSVGAVGAVLLAVLFALRVIRAAGFALKNTEDAVYPVFAALCAVCVFTLVDGMAEVTTLFVIVFIPFVYRWASGLLHEL
ncbi:MAG: O-antigen ligase family protein, partial [Clostridiales bacterium]|nr:O-antigen ligase family protein [Clostridiales bacterium]